MSKEAVRKICAVLIALLLWQTVSMLVGMEALLASPVSVVRRLFSIISEEGFLKTVMYSVLRISLGFCLALVFSCILAVAAGRYHVVEILLWPYVVTIKTVPVASFIILCLIWFSYSQLTVLIAFLIAFPVIYSNVLQGIKSVDRQMLEMADLYKTGWGRKLLYVYYPSIKPYLLSACGIAVGMAWKAGVAAEVIGVVNNSIGERLYESKIYFLNADLLSWTVVIIILSVAGEALVRMLLKAVFYALERL